MGLVGDFKNLLIHIVWTIFFLSTIVEVNTIFLVVLPILYPINPSWWRAFAEAFMDRVWSAIPWGMEYFGGNKVHWYGTKVPEREKAIVLTNHTHYCDWMICFALAVRARLVIGWVLKSLGYVSVSRDRTKDQKVLRAGFQVLSRSNRFWLVIHPEGTRITPEKLKDSQEFARKRNLPVLNHIMMPRMRDLTIAYTRAPPNLFFLLNGIKKFQVHVHVRRYPIAELPSEEKALEQWLIKRWQEKDELLAYYKQHGRFPGEELTYQQPMEFKKFMFYKWPIIMICWTLFWLKIFHYL